MHNGGLVQIKLGLKIPLPFFEFSWSWRWQKRTRTESANQSCQISCISLHARRNTTGLGLKLVILTLPV
jgi:hypothetical protein